MVMNPYELKYSLLKDAKDMLNDPAMDAAGIYIDSTFEVT